MKPEDEEYIVQRIDEERRRAHEANDPAVARVHEQFVRQYESVIAGQGRPSSAVSRS